MGRWQGWGGGGGEVGWGGGRGGWIGRWEGLTCRKVVIQGF